MTTKLIAIVTVLIGLAVLAGCMPEATVKKQAAPESSAAPVPAGETEKGPQPDARIQASLKLTEQGRHFLQNQQPDKAIRMFEQAISLNPVNGQNYYYLAEARLIKGELTEAREFNRLAETYLKQDPEWLLRVARQAERIAGQQK
jgi:tetratricopeptide (TPR) repeat protein